MQLFAHDISQNIIFLFNGIKFTIMVYFLVEEGFIYLFNYLRGSVLFA